MDYEVTVYVGVSIFPCEWFLYRFTQRWDNDTHYDRWQVGCFVIERTRKGVRTL